MIKSYERLKKLNKEKIKIPKYVQDTIPVDTIYKDGIFRCGNKYTKSYRFLDINYKIASGEDKNNLFLSYSDLLNSFDSSVMTKITINNRKVDIRKFKKNILIPLKQDGLDPYREEYNNMLLDKLSESDDIIQEKYITVTVFKNTIDEARFTFSRITTEFSTLFARLGSSCIELNAEERLKILHDFYRNETEEFNLNINDLAKKGHSFKDLITPRMCKYHNKYFEFDGKYGRVLYLNNYPGFLKDEFVSELCDLNRNLMYSMDIITIPTDEAVREVENKFLGVEKNITDWQMKQNRNNNFSAIIPYDMELQRKECKEFLDDLIVRDQRMMLCNITVVHLADSLEELDKDSETLKAVARKYVCELETLYFSKRQLDGLQTVLPIGVNKLNITRTLLTESAAVFIPFRAHEIMQKGGIWYGQNAITNNPILCNKALLQNPNSFVLGIPGAGKSFLTKEELELLDQGPRTQKHITGEVCVHHLWFNDQAYHTKGNLVKWNPAIKTEEDRQALLQALNDNRLDIIATDHAPHLPAEKAGVYTQSASGGPMVQHSLVVMLELMEKGQITLENIVDKMCHAPADIFHVEERGYLREGYKADIAIFEKHPWRIKKENLLYKCGWSPLEEMSFTYQVSMTLVNGQIVYDHGKINDHVRGEMLTFY